MRDDPSRPSSRSVLATIASGASTDDRSRLDRSAWWRRGVIYQVYPRSFQDSNGDGIGDLPGILARLRHLAALGADAVWLSPIYPSPMADFGYDVSDFTAIDPVFGTLADFDRLVAAAHDFGLRVILDYVPNHTSDRHPWFRDSRASRASPKRDWYIWRDPAANGGPPNNWLSEFGGSAWTLDPATGQYYYHAYLAEQPDLNWRNPAVVAAMLDVLRFWLDRGVDGFRVDAIHHLIEDAALRDNPPNPDWRAGLSPSRRVIRAHTMDQPEVHDAIAAMRRVTDAYPGQRVLIGEAYLPIDRLMAYYGADLSGFHLPFNFHLLSTPWEARAIAALIEEYEAALPPGGWPNWVLGNHDRSRLASRIGRDQARVAAMLLLTLRGTPTIYQGEEIGMEDVPIPPERVQDPWERNVPGIGLGRDPVRTPMQWDASPNAGFTTGAEPWLPLAPDHGRVNVAAQAADPRSLYSLYRALIALRRAEPALAVGAYVPISATEQDVLAYERRDEVTGRRLLIALNLGRHRRRLPEMAVGAAALLWTHREARGEVLESGAELAPAEGVVAALPERTPADRG
jgi:alpha-glucosidase